MQLLHFFISTAQAVSLPDFSKTSDLPGFISSVYSFALTIVGIAVFIRILYAGFLMLTAAGNSSKWGDAKTKMQNAVIGTILLLAAYLILYVINPDLVKNTFNFSLPKSNVSTSTPSVPTTIPTNGPAIAEGTPTKGTTGFFDGVINKAQAAGVYTITLKVVDAAGNSCTQSYNLEISPQGSSLKVKQNNTAFKLLELKTLLGEKAKAADDCSVVSLSTNPLPNGTEGVFYHAEIPASNGKTPYVYSIIDGSLPPGLDLQPAKGAVAITSGEFGSARYIKVDMTRSGWIAWREVEVYDKNGKKITPAGATVSCDWCNYPAKNQEQRVSSPGSQGAIDNNPSTNWNAGETAPGCNWISGGGCLPTSQRSAWIKLDLGSAKNVGKVRLLHQGDSFNAQITVSSSADGQTFATLGTLGGIFYDNTWTEIPLPALAGNPSVTFTANGKTSLDTQYGAGIKFNWSSSNVDYLIFQIDNGKAGDEACHSGLSKTNRIMEPFDNFSTIAYSSFLTYNLIIPLNGSDLPYYLRQSCMVGNAATLMASAGANTSTLTLTGVQRATGKTAVATVTINVTVPSGPLMFRSAFSCPPLPRCNGLDQMPSIKPGGSVQVDVTRAEGRTTVPLPSVDQSSVPAGFTVAAKGETFYARQFIITVPTNAKDGTYFIRFNGSGSGILDVGIKVSASGQ